MKDIEDRQWQKYMDRAIKECDHKTVDMLTLLPPRVSAVMLIEMGRKLCEKDEFEKITKQLKPKWWEVWKHAQKSPEK